MSNITYFCSAQDNNSDLLTVTINTNKQNYGLYELVEITGMVYNGLTNESVKTKVLIHIYSKENLVYDISTVSDENGSYIDNGYYISESGYLNITVSAFFGESYETSSVIIQSTATETILDLIFTYPIQFILIFAALVYFVIMLIIVTRQHDICGIGEEDEKNKNEKIKVEKDNKRTSIPRWILRPRMFVVALFLLLSIFTISILCILFFTPTQIGVRSPMGLVQNTFENNTQWVINLGGIKMEESSQYLGGVQIPVYVIALSFVGAYVYFLDKVPELVEEKVKSLYDVSLKYLVRFFISPLLAVALYLVLWQIEVRGQFILAAVSFATGLIIEQVSQRIIEFAQDVLGKKSSENNQNNANTSDSESNVEVNE